MTSNSIIYLFPLVVDIIVSLALFVGRHSLAEKGMDTRTVGMIITIYGVGYVISSSLMGKIIRQNKARVQMLAALILIILFLCALANTQNIRLVLVLFCGIPFATSMFFNAFQSFMLNINSTTSKPLFKTVGYYTCAWSIGFALGPIVSSLVKSIVSWSAAYYTAALIAAGIGVIALAFKPGKNTLLLNDKMPAQSSDVLSKPAMPITGWIGMLIGWTGWNMIATYWPVQAATAGFPTNIKGTVEFCFAISQAGSALLLSFFSAWYHRPQRLPVFAAFGVAGLVLFAFSKSSGVFMLAALAYGIYSGSFCCYMVFHAMLEKEKSIKRVSINETIVGISFILAPMAASSIFSIARTFKISYLCIAALIAIGVAVQTALARSLIKKHYSYHG